MAKEQGKRRDGKTPAMVALNISFHLPSPQVLGNLGFPEDAADMFRYFADAWKYYLPGQWPGCWLALGRVCNALLKKGVIEHEWQRKMVSILVEKPQDDIDMNKGGVRVKIESPDDYSQ